MMNLEKNTESKSHLKAVGQALFVAFLWSTSWVLIKIGIRENLPPVTFAGPLHTCVFLPYALDFAKSKSSNGTA